MNGKRWMLVLAVCCLVCVGVAGAAGVKDLVAKMPQKDAANGQAVMAEIVKLGPPAVREICGMLLTPAEEGDDAKAEYCLQGLAMYCSRPGGDADRKMLEGALLEALAAEKKNENRAELIRHIQLVGGDGSVATLAKLLTDDRLCEPATQALERIGTAAAKAALAAALPAAKGKRRITLVRSTGMLRVKAAAKTIAASATSEDPVLRRLAWWALANLGEASAGKLIEPALLDKNPYERSQALSYYLLLARRLAAGGDKDTAALMCRNVLAKKIPSRGNHAACAALAVLVDVTGKAAMTDLLTSVDHPDKKVREAVLRLGAELPGLDVSKAWVTKAGSARPEVKAEIIAMLGRRGELATEDAVKDALTDDAKEVRLAAIVALAKFGAKVATAPLLGKLSSADKDEAALARTTLGWLRGEGFGAAVGALLAKTDAPAGRVGLLDLLASRGETDQAGLVLTTARKDSDEGVRIAALHALARIGGKAELPGVLERVVKTTGSEQTAARKAAVAICKQTGSGAAPVLAVMNSANTAARIALLQALPSLGGAEALRAVLADTASRDAGLQDAAVRAVAAWLDPAAAKDLLAIASKTSNKVHHVLALRGYVRLVGLLPPSPKAVDMLRAGLAASKDAGDRRLMLGGLGKVRDDEALKTLMTFLDGAELREEAAAAIVRIACPQNRRDPGHRTPAAKAALQKVVEVSKNRAVVDKARQQLAKAFKVRAAAPAPDPIVPTRGQIVHATVQQQGTHGPELAVDGVIDNDSAWFGARWPSSLIVDLAAPTKIDAVRVVFYSDGRFYQYTVDVSADGKTWKTVVDNSGNSRPATLAGQAHKFDPVEVKHVRLNVKKNSANEAVHVVEFEAYAAGKAPANLAYTKPTPAGQGTTSIATPAPNPKKGQPAPAAKIPPLGKGDKDGYISLFNGKDLTGWVGSIKGYTVEDGSLVCLKRGGGNLYTAQQFSDFILQFDFKLTKAANNGLGIRAPLKGNAAYAGMELQIIDTPGWPGKLRPYQVHGSIYGVVPAKTGFLKPVGEWNHQEVHAVGPQITVILNGHTIVDANLDKVEKFADGSNAQRHPGIFRRIGHIGWLGHGARVEWKNIKVKPLHPYTQGPLNTPPAGFKALFNGKDLAGWKGLVGNPKTRAKMTPEQLQAAQAKADQKVKEHWKIVEGTLVYDGKGTSLCTAKDYGDFEMYVDWKIHPGGDSGIYLRGSPQVQIWQRPEGSGGLFNNKKNPSKPLVCADNPPNQWNRFRIKMIGERVSVWLNGVPVVKNTVMENYWDRSIPIYPKGQIELQHHGSTLWFRNIYIREIPAGEK